MNLLEVLQSFGLTQYEAKAFIALVTENNSTPYQISKISGIPRARIYDILESLLNKGYIMVQEMEDGSKIYSSLPIEVFLQKQKHSWDSAFQTLEVGLKELEEQKTKDDYSVLTVKGNDSILSFCIKMIMNAKEQILLSIWNPMYEALLPELQLKLKEGCRVSGIAFDVNQPLPGIFLHRQNEYMESLSTNKWFILSVDSRELFYGHAAEKDEGAFYTDDPVHIFLLEDYIWHDALVNRLVDKGEQRQLDKWILKEMEDFFGKKKVPESFWEKFKKIY